MRATDCRLSAPVLLLFTLAPPAIVASVSIRRLLGCVLEANGLMMTAPAALKPRRAASRNGVIVEGTAGCRLEQGPDHAIAAIRDRRRAGTERRYVGGRSQSWTQSCGLQTEYPPIRLRPHRRQCQDRRRYMVTLVWSSLPSTRLLSVLSVPLIAAVVLFVTCS